LPAAQAVAECPFSLLASLTDRSFVQRDPEGRYSIHEVLRQYAWERKQRRHLRSTSWALPPG
ncbi:MAG: hypothetical protein WAW26_19990, partial [Anaerolineae bacterium]